jgi:hypothetical protein
VGLLEALGMEDDYEMVDVRVAAGEEDAEVEEEWVGGEWVTRKTGRDGDDEEGGTGGGGVGGSFGGGTHQWVSEFVTQY